MNKDVRDLTNETNKNRMSKEWEENGLTRGQNLFVDNYILTENAQKSYMMAYPRSNENSAAVNGSKLLGMEKIQNEIAKRRAEIKAPNIATPEDMFKLLTSMMYDPEIRPSDRMKAIELLGKNQALWIDRVETTTDTNFTVNLIGMNEDERKEIGEYIEGNAKLIDHDE